MRVLLFGSTGQVGHALQGLSRSGEPSSPQWICLTRQDCDLADAASIRAAIERVRPDAIVNAAAYTAVDKAESDREACYLVNATAPGVMAAAAAPMLIGGIEGKCHVGERDQRQRQPPQRRDAVEAQNRLKG